MPDATEETKLTQAEVDALIEDRLKRDRQARSGASAQERAELDSLRREKAERDREAEVRAGNFAKLEASLKGELDALRKQTAEQIGKAEEALRAERVRGAILAAASKANAHDAEQIADLLERRVRLGDDYKPEVVDKTGNVVYARGGVAQTVEGLVTSYLDANPHLVRAGHTAGGAGARGGASMGADSAGAPAGVSAAQKAYTEAEAAAKAEPMNTALGAALLRAQRVLEAAKRASDGRAA